MWYLKNKQNTSRNNSRLNGNRPVTWMGMKQAALRGNLRQANIEVCMGLQSCVKLR